MTKIEHTELLQIFQANKGSSKLKKLLSIAPEARNKKHVKMVRDIFIWY